MDWVKAINSSIEFMENHLRDEVSVEDIAKCTHITPFHFQRTFSALTGMSPMEYLRRRPPSQAGMDLVNGEETIIAIAQKYCYDSVQSFSKAFTRFHGCSPIHARKVKNIRFMNRYGSSYRDPKLTQNFSVKRKRQT